MLSIQEVLGASSEVDCLHGLLFMGESGSWFSSYCLK